MFFATLWPLILASSAYSASASALHNGRNIRAAAADPICGTTVDPAAIAASEANVRRHISETSVRSRQHDNSSVLLPIDVYMQVLSADGTEEGGNIRDATIEAQLQVLNDAFKPVGFQFRLIDTIRTINERWYYNLKPVGDVEKEVIQLRRGGNATLNIYTMGALNTTTQAWGTVPSELSIHDGVFQNGTVFLGGSDPEFNLGDTLVHEVGHWFGLYHTFAYGCEKSYDYVDDTPIEDQPPVLGGCDVGRDSCPDQPGLDLVREVKLTQTLNPDNYMSYSSDECRNSWTPGQIQRMREQMAKYRGVVYPGIIVGDIPEDS
ncbi:hypothetical protein K505DRAFT_415708, partial [Melanomma pulvis-pyrius CBS 109.77]